MPRAGGCGLSPGSRAHPGARFAHRATRGPRRDRGGHEDGLRLVAADEVDGALLSRVPTRSGLPPDPCRSPSHHPASAARRSPPVSSPLGSIDDGAARALPRARQAEAVDARRVRGGGRVVRAALLRRLAAAPIPRHQIHARACGTPAPSLDGTSCTRAGRPRTGASCALHDGSVARGRRRSVTPCLGPPRAGAEAAGAHVADLRPAGGAARPRARRLLAPWPSSGRTAPRSWCVSLSL